MKSNKTSISMVFVDIDIVFSDSCLELSLEWHLWKSGVFIVNIGGGGWERSWEFVEMTGKTVKDEE